MSTPMNWTSECSPAAVLSSGASATQGAHHDPHTFTMTGVPSSCVRSRSNVGTSIVGKEATSPGRSAVGLTVIAGDENDAVSPAAAHPVHATAIAAISGTRRRGVTRAW